jgi:hypothetical protein
MLPCSQTWESDPCETRDAGRSLGAILNFVQERGQDMRSSLMRMGGDPLTCSVLRTVQQSLIGNSPKAAPTIGAHCYRLGM